MTLFGWEITRAKSPQTRFLGDLVKVTLSPGDVCVLMCPDTISPEYAARMSETWRATIGDDVRCIVLDRGMKLGVLSPPQAAALHDALHEVLTDEAAVTKAVA